MKEKKRAITIAALTLIMVAVCVSLVVIFIKDDPNENVPPTVNDTTGISAADTPTVPEDGFKYSLLSDGTYAVRGVENMELEEIVIPSTYNGKAVTRIVDRAFENCKFKKITIPDSVTAIGKRGFYNCTGLTEVYYDGTESEWNTISIGSFNTKLTNATRYYYSETQPTVTGNYWHYVDGVPTVW